MNKSDYKIADVLCENILSDFDVFADMQDWLKKYKQLYNKVNIQPVNLPAIANCNFEGVRYEYIAKFHGLYEKTDYEYHILDHKSHEEAIVYFFEQMNSFMIGHYLTEEYYMGMDVPDFFYSLGNAFQELQNRGNERLYAEVLECCSCKQKQYFLKGNKDCSYLHLIFKIENGVVNDFIECRELKCELPVNINPENQVFIDTITPPF